VRCSLGDTRWLAEAKQRLLSRQFGLGRMWNGERDEDEMVTTNPCAGCAVVEGLPTTRQVTNRTGKQ
jgi:hypothetical protein